MNCSSHKEVLKSSVEVISLKMFSNESLVGRFFGHLGDIIIVNLLFVISCIPVITIGAALCGMNYAFLKRRRESQEPISRLYFTGFRDNFRQGSIAWIITLFCLTFLTGDYIASSANGMFESPALHVISAVTLAIVSFVAIWLFAVIPSFENSLRNLIMQAAMLSASHLPATLCIAAAILALVYLLTASLFNLLFVGSLCIIFGFGLIAWLASFAFIRAFSPYL